MFTRGYTLVEMMVSIAIMSIMLGIVGFNYGASKKYDTLNLENQRLASTIRNVRNRDFNGVTAAVDKTADPIVYAHPTGGYGLFLAQKYMTCGSVSTGSSCYLSGSTLECSGGEICGVPSSSGSSYVLFADLNDNGAFNDGKTGNEFIEEFKLPSDYSLVFTGGVAKKAHLMFKSGVARVTNVTGTVLLASAPSDYPITVNYAPGGTVVCGSQTRSLKGRVTVNLGTKSITEQLVSCP